VSGLDIVQNTNITVAAAILKSKGFLKHSSC
jgi:hypothetical protein